mgnify:CR=1 FL=1|tara:strand:+ start:34662 stop:35174 length:513 start_codon:yes stop_codon:yes gene_type:complete
MNVSTKLKFEYLPLALLVLILAFVAGSELFPTYRKQSWTFLFVAFALISCAFSYFSHQTSSFSKHLILWLGALFALMTVFVFEQAGLINASQMAMFILVLLGFATFSSGLYGSVAESGIGLLLLVYAVIMAMLEEYLWVLWVFIVLLVAFQVFRLKKRGKTKALEEKAAV